MSQKLKRRVRSALTSSDLDGSQGIWPRSTGHKPDALCGRLYGETRPYPDKTRLGTCFPQLIVCYQCVHRVRVRGSYTHMLWARSCAAYLATRFTVQVHTVTCILSAICAQLNRGITYSSFLLELRSASHHPPDLSAPRRGRR